MAAYNAGRFFAPAVESILGQTMADFEFIIVDDCSTDGTREAAQSRARKDPRMKVVTNEQNLGVSTALNRGIAEARSEWIARMDADDISHPRRLERQLALAQSRPDAGFITTLLESIDTSGRRVAKAKHGLRIQPELLPWFLLFYNRIAGGGQVMFRRDTILAAGGYDITNRPSQDRDLWPRLLRCGPCVVLPQVLYQWRSSPGSITNSLRFRYADESLKVDQREIAASCGAELPLEEVTALRDFWTRFHCQGQDWDAVQRRLLSLATRYRPPRPVKNLRTQLRSSISFGWLANTIRASRLRDVTLFCGHLRRAREAAGARFPLVWMRFVRELAAVGGNADRLT